MNSSGRCRKPVIAGVVVILAAFVSGCNEHASTSLSIPSAAPTRPTAVRTSAPSAVTTAPPTTDTAEQARIRAAWHAGKPAKDLVWRVPNDPRTWTKLPKKQDGLQEWHVKPGCYVRLWQLSGVGGKHPMTARDVLEETAELESALFPGKPKPAYRSHGTIVMTGFVRGISDIAQVKMASSTVDYGGKARAQLIAYRDGDLALSYTSYCATVESFKKVAASDLDAWRSQLAEETAY